MKAEPVMKPEDKGVASQILHDARCVHDMASLGLEDVQKADTWLVVELQPGPDSGAGTVPSTMVDGATGQVVQAPPHLCPKGSPEGSATLLEGTWQQVDALSREVSASEKGTYSWYEPKVTRQRETTADSFYNPFAKGGFVLGKYPCVEQPEQLLCPYFLLPPGWELSMRQAYELAAWRSVPESKDRNATPSALAEQTSLQILQSIRSAMQEGNLKPAVLLSSLQRKDVFLEAAVLYLLLLKLPTSEVEMLESFNAAVARGSQKAVALALLTRLLLRKPELRAPRLERHMLAKLETHANRDDPYFREIFRVSGLV